MMSESSDSHKRNYPIQHPNNASGASREKKEAKGKRLGYIWRQTRQLGSGQVRANSNLPGNEPHSAQRRVKGLWYRIGCCLETFENFEAQKNIYLKAKKKKTNK